MPVIEAMSYGKPVVGFDVGGPKYTIEDGVNGYSVKERDCERMGEKIILLLLTPELRKNIGDSGKSLFKKYKWTNIVKSYEEVIINEK